MAMRSLRSVMPKCRASGTPGAAFVGGMLEPSRRRGERRWADVGEAKGSAAPGKDARGIDGDCRHLPGEPAGDQAGRDGGKHNVRRIGATRAFRERFHFTVP